MRGLLFIPPALLVSLLLFLLMAHLAGVGRAPVPDTSAQTSINLHRLKTDSDVQVRERDSLPPPEILPEQPPAPTPPDMSRPTPVNAAAAALNMTAPTLDMNIRINAAADLSSVQAVAAPAPAPGISMQLNATPVSRMNPQYPRRALARRVEGFVVAEFTVDPQGRVVPDSFKIVEASPPGMFERAVERALLRWRFNPLTEGGQAVPFRTRQRLEFKLE